MTIMMKTIVFYFCMFIYLFNAFIFAKKHRESLNLFVVFVDSSWFICVYYKLEKMVLNDSNSQQGWNLLQTGCFETLKKVNHALLTFKLTQCNISL